MWIEITSAKTPSARMHVAVEVKETLGRGVYLPSVLKGTLVMEVRGGCPEDLQKLREKGIRAREVKNPGC